MTTYYTVSGTKTETARIIVIKESDWSIESNTVVSGSGQYGLTHGHESGNKTVIAIGASGRLLGYSGVTPVTFYPPFVIATGGTITYDGDFKIHKFTSNSTFTVDNPGYIEFLMLGGGGGGAGTPSSGYGGGGGGAGGYVYSASYYLSLTGELSITIGAGGSGGAAGGNNNGSNGNNTTFAGFTAYGGGGGGRSQGNGLDGGCGGGSGGKHSFDVPGYHGGTGSQGYDGGDNDPAGVTQGASGGGGIGAEPTARAYSNRGQPGGNGLQLSITGTPTYYGGGGGGGHYSVGAESENPGGLGGGGHGAWSSSKTGGGGTNGLGGGGGGSFCDSPGFVGGAGGSGVVIIRYRYQ